MKDFVCRMQSLLFFDSPYTNLATRETFARIHSYQQQQFSHWPLAATRKKLIARFWFRYIVRHFLLILLLGSGLIFPFYHQWQSFLPAMLIASVISFASLLLFVYGPGFYSQFLPTLDTIMAEQDKLLTADAETKKCKRSQFSIATLTIIFYVFAKAGNIPLPAANDQSAGLLNNLFGADKDKLKQNLSRLYKISHLSARERAEMLKGIEVSRDFFEALALNEAQKLLDNLEYKLQKTGS